MEHVQELKLKNGQVLLSLTGYTGEEDFYLLYDIIQTQLQPSEISYGVDSMCVDGSFRKDGILVRMSSECVTDCCCLHYDPTGLTEAEVQKVQGWITQVVAALHQQSPRF